MWQERLQEVRQRRTPRPLLVSVPPKAERKGTYERIRRQNPPPNARRRVRYPRRSTTGDLAQHVLMYACTSNDARLYIIWRVLDRTCNRVTDLRSETCNLKPFPWVFTRALREAPLHVGLFYALFCGLIALEEPSTLPEASMALTLT